MSQMCGAFLFGVQQACGQWFFKWFPDKRRTEPEAHRDR